MSQASPAPGTPRDRVVVETETAAVVQPSLLARLGAEMFGSFFLVLAILGVAMWARFFNANLALAVGLAGGLALLAAIAAVGHVSGGHFNPAVTLGAAIAGRSSWRDVLPYWLAQLVGAVLAGLVLFATVPEGALGVLADNGLIEEATRQGFIGTTANGFEEHAPLVATFAGAGAEVTVPLVSALLIEVVITAVFVGVVLGVTDKRATDRVAPVAIGLAFAVVLTLSLPLTNGSANPARSFASAVFAGGWAFSQLWLFIVAPLLGAAIAALFYRAFAVAPTHDDLLGEDRVVVTDEETSVATDTSSDTATDAAPRTTPEPAATSATAEPATAEATTAEPDDAAAVPPATDPAADAAVVDDERARTERTDGTEGTGGTAPRV